MQGNRKKPAATIRTALVACFYCHTKRTIENLFAQKDGPCSQVLSRLLRRWMRKGNVSRSCLKNSLISCRQRYSAIVSVGTTGESYTLSHDEHGDVVMMTLELADGRIPVTCRRHGRKRDRGSVSLTQRFSDNDIVGCLTVTPYYNRPRRKVCSSISKPSRNTLTCRKFCIMCRPVPVAICCRKPWVVGDKKYYRYQRATGRLNPRSPDQSWFSDDFILLSGDDASALNFMQLGGHGVISVTANVAARETVYVCKLAAEGQFAEARAINQRLMPLQQTICQTILSR